MTCICHQLCSEHLSRILFNPNQQWQMGILGSCFFFLKVGEVDRLPKDTEPRICGSKTSLMANARVHFLYCLLYVNRH